MSQCPDTQVVISGYSQGGQLVHNAAEQLSADITGSIAAAVIFGDPGKNVYQLAGEMTNTFADNGDAVQGVSADKTDIICHDTDNICQGGATILPSHLTYGTENAGEAADFVAGATGF